MNIRSFMCAPLWNRDEVIDALDQFTAARISVRQGEYKVSICLRIQGCKELRNLLRGCRLL